MIATNGRAWIRLSGMSVTPAACRGGAERDRDPEEERGDDDAERPSAGEHGDDDRHEALPLREERLEAPGAGDREVGAADAGERTGREHGVGAGRDDADAGGVERLRLLACGAEVQTDVRRAEDPGEQCGEGEAEVDDHRLAEERGLAVQGLAEDRDLVEQRDRDRSVLRRGAAACWRTGFDRARS